MRDDNELKKGMIVIARYNDHGVIKTCECTIAAIFPYTKTVLIFQCEGPLVFKVPYSAIVKIIDVQELTIADTID